MDQSQRDELKKRMKEEMATLAETIEALDEHRDPVEPDVAIGRLSRLDTMQSQAMASATQTKAKRRLRLLEAALARIDDDEEYGTCYECGDPIPMARLLALPESNLCVDCAE